MTTIQNDRDLLTLVNVFDVAPERQQELADLLIEATETMRGLPGFISANIHTSYDGRRVVNYAQWESQAHFDAMLQNPHAQPHMGAAARMVASYDPILCRVVHADSLDPA